MAATFDLSVHIFPESLQGFGLILLDFLALAYLLQRLQLFTAPGSRVLQQALVSAWAGHKHFATTSTYYTQVSCELMEREAGHIQKALVNSNGQRVLYESFPKSFWENPTAHKLELGGTHINTPIYGYCGLPLDQDCHKFRACYTCQSFVATINKLPQYINTRDELRAKQAKAISAGQEVLVEQFGTQADRLDQIIASLQQEAA